MYIQIFSLGLLYTYLAGYIGHKGDGGACRSLTRGYNHWASGRLDQLEINVNHPEYCHIRCLMKASMKSNTYHIYLLLRHQRELATVVSVTCECAAE